MQIKLLKKAQWGGETRRAGTIHEVDVLLGEKLIARDLAEAHTPSEAPDAPATDE